MKRKRYTEEQIAFALRQAESGVPVVEICRKMGVSEKTSYAWKKKYDGMGEKEAMHVIFGNGIVGVGSEVEDGSEAVG